MPEYTPLIFHQTDITRAKEIILTPENGMTTEKRWKEETRWLAPLLEFDDGLVIDYGRGIGRVAKEITCNPVLGVDLSLTMRMQAETYVDRWDFGSVGPMMFYHLVEAGLRARGAIAIWTLQHAKNPKADIWALKRSLLPGARIYVLNRLHRALPVMDDGKFDWLDDRIDVREILRSEFHEESYIVDPSEVIHPGAFFGTYLRA